MMAVVEELIRTEADGTISFGNYELDLKAKVTDFPQGGDLYKVKTYKVMTKLEKNGMLIYESVPGTCVTNFAETENGIKFLVNGKKNAQITVELEAEVEYEVFTDDKSLGKMLTNLAGKLNFSLELAESDIIAIKILK